MAKFETNGINIYYKELGNKDSENCIAFFNGVMATTSSWELLYPTFERLGWRIILHDFKGQLKSDKPTGSYTFKEHADEAKALFDHLGVQKVHIVGTSYGGEVAMKFAMEYPETTTSISVIDSVSETDSVLEAFVRSWKELADLGNGEKFFWSMAPSVYGSTFLQENHEACVKRAQAMNNIPKEYFQGQKALYDTFLGNVHMTDKLHTIKCPTLIICGEGDILKPPKFSQTIADNIPGAEYITIPDCGHVAIFEKPKELESAILGFTLKHSPKLEITTNDN